MKKLSWSFWILLLGFSVGSLNAQNPHNGGKQKLEAAKPISDEAKAQMKAESKLKIQALPNQTHAPGIAPFSAISNEKMKAFASAQSRNNTQKD